MALTRRQILVQGILTAFGMALGKYDALAQDGGLLRVPLGQWEWLVFEYRGRRVAIKTDEVFAALEESYGSAPIDPKMRKPIK